MLNNINHILIIDDSPINVEFLSIYFEKFNVEITKAFSTDEARKKLSEKAFDLTLVDYHMPIEDGISFIKAMKVNDKLDSLGKIIIVTADTEFNLEESGLFNDIKGKLNKPLDITDLNKLLE